MSTWLTFEVIHSLPEFVQWVMPVCQESYDYTASLPKKEGKSYINIVPEGAASIAADQFLRKLPSEYRKRTRKPNPVLITGRKIDLKKPVPAGIVEQTIRRMTILFVKDESEVDQRAGKTATTADVKEVQ